jgi:PhoPQ-activated pathogenicity-related protein
MYIEFRLPQQPISAGWTLKAIKQLVAAWAEKYQIEYTQKTIKYTHRVAFDDDRHYSLFSLTWSPPSDWRLPSPCIIQDLNNKI